MQLTVNGCCRVIGVPKMAIRDTGSVTINGLLCFREQSMKRCALDSSKHICALMGGARMKLVSKETFLPAMDSTIVEPSVSIAPSSEYMSVER